MTTKQNSNSEIKEKKTAAKKTNNEIIQVQYNKFSLFAGGKLPEFEMTVLSAKNGSRSVIKDEAGTFI